MQQEFIRYGVDLGLAGQERLWQQPVVLHPDRSRRPLPVAQLTAQVYGRFGNNVFQTLNALVIATRLRIPVVSLCGLAMHQPMPHDQSLGLEVVIDQPAPQRGSNLVGNFYAPYGFERLFTSVGLTDLADLLARSAGHLWGDLIGKSVRSQSLVLHFRGGDIFRAGEVHRWYVQPPASYYLAALDHAVRSRTFDSIELVYEDRSNPAIEVVEAGLDDRGLAFASRSSTLGADLNRVFSATCIISSYGTFCEAVGLLSRHLESYYSFRSVSSQVDLHPFTQMALLPLLRSKGVRCVLCDDIAYEYTLPKTWMNDDAQRSAIRTYPAHHLRLYEV